MTPLRRAVLAFAATLALGACAGLGGPPTLRMSESELDAAVQRRLPLERRVLEVFDLTLPAARVRLLPELDRIRVGMEVRLRERLLGRAWKGQLTLDAALRWEPQDQTVRLTQVQVLDLRIDGNVPTGRAVIEQVGAALAERGLDELVVYTLPAERAAELARRGFTPAALKVTDRGVEVTLAPARR
jgi:Protein of unknown function (DUF1439)